MEGFGKVVKSVWLSNYEGFHLIHFTLCNIEGCTVFGVARMTLFGKYPILYSSVQVQMVSIHGRNTGFHAFYSIFD